MSFREVTMIEVKEVLRQWLARVPKKRIAARLGSDPKTVRHYIGVAEQAGLRQDQGPEALTDEVLGAVAASLRSAREREHGAAWVRCEEQKEFISKALKNRVRLTKVRKLLRRHGVDVPYSTLHRFAVDELDFGKRGATVPVADGEPGEELQVDTGWMTLLEPDESGKRRRFRAWIFTPCVSRYRFVYPCLRETTATAIEACEAAWEFYDGIFHVLVPDNTKTIINEADPLEPKVTLAFLEYAQARGFVIDPTRARHPKDKARVEKSVRDTRDDCFGGERLVTVEDARLLALMWCTNDYGLRPHSTTLRMPREHFDTVEKAALLPAPSAPYDIPIWCDPKVAHDHFAQVARSLYTLPTHLIGHKLRARADRTTVRFYEDRVLVKTHPRVAPGRKSIDPSDFPAEKTPYAMRDVAYLEREAARRGESVGGYAKALLAGPLPWTRMRRVRALLGLARKYGDRRVDQACATALAHDMVDVRRLERMLVAASPPAQTPPPAPNVIPIARYLRPASQYALPFAQGDCAGTADDPDHHGEDR